MKGDDTTTPCLTRCLGSRWRQVAILLTGVREYKEPPFNDVDTYLPTPDETMFLLAKARFLYLGYMCAVGPWSPEYRIGACTRHGYVVRAILGRCYLCSST
jgi:hypothetical protein